MKGRVLVGLLCLGVVLSTAGCNPFGGKVSATRTVRLGADLSLTGDHADTGRVLRDALHLQVSRINEQRPIPHMRFALVVRDNRSLPEISRDNVRDFEHDDKMVAAVTGGCDPCVVRTAGMIAAGDLPMISLSPVGLPPHDAVDGSALFKLAPNPTDDATALIGLLSRAHAKRAVLISEPGQYPRQATEALVRAAHARQVHLRTVRLPASAQKVSRHDLYPGYQRPDAVLVLAPPGHCPGLVHSVRHAGFHGTVALDPTSASGLFLDDDRLEGSYLVFPPILAMDDLVASTPEKAAQKEWFDDYTSRYGEYAATSSFAGDAVRVVAAAILAADGTDRGRLRDAIETIQMDGLSGPVRFTPSNHSGLTPQGLMVLRAANGRWHLTSPGGGRS